MSACWGLNMAAVASLLSNIDPFYTGPLTLDSLINGVIKLKTLIKLIQFKIQQKASKYIKPDFALLALAHSNS